MAITRGNLAYGTILTAPSPATSGTSFVLQSGEGAYFPAITTGDELWGTLCPVGQAPSMGTAEIVKVTARSTDTFTIVRAQRGTTARSVAVGWQFFAGVYIEDIVEQAGIHRQAITNGNFDVWQKGTSFTGNLEITSDRWYKNTSSGCTFSRQDGTGVYGSQYSMRVSRDNGGATGGSLYLLYAGVETADIIKLRGKKLTLSFWAKKGADFSAASSNITLKMLSGTGTNENFGSTGTFATGNATVIDNTNFTLTTSWQKFTITTPAVISSTVNSLSFHFSWTSVGTSGAADNFEITQVQLCAGDVALPFMPKSYDDELRACRRYTYVPDGVPAYARIGIGMATNTTTAKIETSIPKMRIVPSLTLTASDWAMTDGVNAPIDTTSITLDTDQSSSDKLLFNIVVASGLTQYRTYGLICDGTGNRIMVLSAEL